ncbi:MAG: sigma 54-interacting transcriptional regulator [Bacteroidales bacterium]|nr:sigma 54-interacting transcriptional regulator [Bacteroidales bacterium]
MDNFPEAVFIKDENLKFSFINKVFEKYFAVNKDNILGKTSYDLFDYETARKFSEQDNKIINSDECNGLTIETEINFNNYIVRKFKLPTNDSKSLLGGIAFDISERKKLENELIKSEQKYRSLVELAYEGFVKTDKEGIITFVNKRFCEIVGRCENELIGKSVFTNADEENSAILKTTFENIKKAEEQKEVIIKITTSKGQTLHLKINASPTFDENGQFSGTLSLITDFTKEIELEKVVSSTRQKLFENFSFHGIFCKSEAMKNIMELMQVSANSDCNLLIEGPSGTGKTHIAKIIHGISNRREKPFITINCGNLPENLLESELFGYSKGAFTGADRDRPGKFSAASGGIIFLDEIGEMPINLQVKLLRVIDEKCYEPIGSNNTIKVDVRIIAATNKNLLSLIAEEKFRSDLYYRLKIVNFTIPPLKERQEDLEILLEDFISFFNNKYNKNIIRVSDETFRFLKTYDFPGNIRELKNMLERAFIFCNSNVIEMQHFSNDYITLFNRFKKGNFTNVNNSFSIKGPTENVTPVSKLLDEKEILIQTLKQCNNNKSEAAISLNISKVTLWRKIKKYGLDAALKENFEDLNNTDKILNQLLTKIEKDEMNKIIEILKKTNNNRKNTAIILKMDRITLWRKMKKYGIK